MQQHAKQLFAPHRQSGPTPTPGPTVAFEQHTNNGRGGGGIPRSLEKTGGGVGHSFLDALPDPATWIDDDRITCNMCQHMEQSLHKINMPAAEFDKIRRENHIANRWMFDIVKIKNNWAKVEYMGWQCNGGQRSYIPINIKHRCDSYKPKDAMKEFNVKEWWE